MSQKTHWKKLMNKDYIGSWDILKGKDLILTIKNAKQGTVKDANGKSEEKLLIYWQENYKPLIANVTNSSAITKVANTPYIEEWSGTKLSLYTERVKAFGEWHEAIRVRDYKPVENIKKYNCEICSSEIQEAAGMSPEAIASYTKRQYGKELCTTCASKIKEEQQL